MSPSSNGAFDLKGNAERHRTRPRTTIDCQPLPDEIRSYAEDVFDTIREPLVILAANLCVKSANRAFYETFKVTPASTEDHLVYELGNGQWDIPALRTLLEDIIPQHSVFNDYEIEHDFPQIGRRIFLLNARQLAADGHTALVVLAMEDVTDRRRIEDLEKRSTDAVQDSLDRLRQLEKMRDNLKQMIVHDLRTPLTSVIAGMQTLDEIGGLNEAQREMVAISLAGGQTLLGMINDLLDVEKMESGSVDLEYAVVRADDLIDDAMGQVGSLLADHALVLAKSVVPGTPEFEGDAGYLKRVLVNLIGNAIKFSPAGGTITVAAEPAEHGRSVLISVIDTGEGIPAGSLARIFDKFAQVESRRSGRQMSTGLGLTFCKLAVLAHGGNIWVESGLEEGSTFRLTLPVCKCAPTKTAE